MLKEANTFNIWSTNTTFMKHLFGQGQICRFWFKGHLNMTEMAYCLIIILIVVTIVVIVCACVYIERDRKRKVYIYIYIYIYAHTLTYIFSSSDMAGLTEVSSNKMFGGWQKVFSHERWVVFMVFHFFLFVVIIFMLLPNWATTLDVDEKVYQYCL